MLHPRPQDWAGNALGFGNLSAGNDFVPARDRCIHRRSIRKMKKKTVIIVGVAAVFLLLAVYLWGPGTAPPGQLRVVTLSKANVAEFAKAFDAEADVPRLVFLLSPT